MIFQHDFWLAGGCVAKHSDTRFENTLLANMDSKMDSS